MGGSDHEEGWRYSSHDGDRANGHITFHQLRASRRWDRRPRAEHQRGAGPL